ncbi:MAG: YceI family protein [Candidatus Obscuribacter sp.]|nr:YceI family protein [Candidatus Obscuribacter sp.]MBP7579276.1 YceI family protein [Candidatus Obscuribacter sp.]
MITDFKALISAIALTAAVGCAMPVLSAESDWTIEPAGSKLDFHLKNMGMGVDGKFTKVSGTVKYDGKNLAQASVDAKVDIDSVDTGNEMRDKHLKTKDFFDMGKYPAAEFTSNKIEVDKSGEFKIYGRLSLHGIPQEVVLNATPLKESVDKAGRKHLTTTATNQIERKSYGIGGLGAASISNEVSLNLTIDLVQ